VDFELIFLGIQNQLIFLVSVWTLKLHDFRGEENMKMQDELRWLPACLICVWAPFHLLIPMFFLCTFTAQTDDTILFFIQPAILKSLFLWRRKREREMERSIFNIQVCLVGLTNNHTKKNFHEIVACWGGQKIGNENACCSLSPMSPRGSIDLS
jgi:hypothetical protein